MEKRDPFFDALDNIECLLRELMGIEEITACMTKYYVIGKVAEGCIQVDSMSPIQQQDSGRKGTPRQASTILW